MLTANQSLILLVLGNHSQKNKRTVHLYPSGEKTSLIVTYHDTPSHISAMIIRSLHTVVSNSLIRKLVKPSPRVHFTRNVDGASPSWFWPPNQLNRTKGETLQCEFGRITIQNPRIAIKLYRVIKLLELT